MFRSLCAACAALFIAHPALALDETALSLTRATHLALERQPQIEAQEARARAARESAVAERQLPDPKLSAGIKDFPVEGTAAGTVTGDNFTMLEVGISQDFPRAEKRRLMGERRLREAEVADVRVEQLRRELKHDAGIAWLEVFRSEQSQHLVEALRHESELLAQSAEISFRSGRAAQSEVLSARVTVELLADRARGLHQQARAARGALSRWIGEAAQQPIASAMPEFAPVPPLADLLQRVTVHPHLLALAKEEDVARADIALAQQDYLPDWGMEAYYANRPAFDDFVGLRVTVGLPVFTANRQDRRLEASRALLSRAEAGREDELRQQTAGARTAYADWEELNERLARFDSAILPSARAAVDAAQATYGAGQSTLGSVLQARQSVLDIELQRLNLAVDAARAQLRLRYLFE